MTLLEPSQIEPKWASRTSRALTHSSMYPFPPRTSIATPVTTRARLQTKCLAIRRQYPDQRARLFGPLRLQP